MTPCAGHCWAPSLPPRPERVTVVRRLAGAIGLLWVALFVAIAGTYLSTWVVGVRVPTIVVWVLPLLGWAVVRLRGPRDRLDLAVAAALVAHLGVSLASRDMLGSLEASGMAFVFALLFWAARDAVGRPASRQRIALGVVIGIAPWLWAAAVAWIGEKITWIALGGGVPGLESSQVFVWGTTNAYPILVLLGLAFAAQIEGDRPRQVARVALGLPALAVVPLSAGRAGWLGLVVALVVLVSLGATAGGRLGAAAEAVRRRSGLALAAGAAAFGLVLVATAVLGGRIGEAVASDLDSRTRIWAQAAGIFLGDPVTGSGPGTFSWVRLEHVAPFTDPVGVVLAHSVPLQVLADGGLVLGVGLGLCALAWLWALVSSLRRLTPASRWAAAGVLGVAAASLLDDFSALPAVTAGVVTLAAWAVPAPRVVRGSSIRWRWSLVGVVALAGAAAVLPTLRVEGARLSADVARASALAGRWAEAAEAYAAAAQAYPSMGAYHLGLGFARAQQGDREAARKAYERVRSLAPGDPRSYGALAALADEPGERRAFLAEAVRRSTDPRHAWALGELLADDGDTSAALEAYARAVVLRPDLLRLVPESGELGRREVAAAVPAAAERAGSLGSRPARQPVWDVGLVTGELPADAPAAWRAVLAASTGELERARGLLAEARDVSPHDPITQLADAFVAAASCDPEAAETTLRRMGWAPAEPSDRLRVERDPVYRELSLGSQLPPAAVELPPTSRWPLGLVPPLETCG